jgi:hypothetical protein
VKFRARVRDGNSGSKTDGHWDGIHKCRPKAKIARMSAKGQKTRNFGKPEKRPEEEKRAFRESEHSTGKSLNESSG